MFVGQFLCNPFSNIWRSKNGALHLHKYQKERNEESKKEWKRSNHLESVWINIQMNQTTQCFRIGTNLSNCTLKALDAWHLVEERLDITLRPVLWCDEDRSHTTTPLIKTQFEVTIRKHGQRGHSTSSRRRNSGSSRSRSHNRRKSMIEGFHFIQWPQRHKQSWLVVLKLLLLNLRLLAKQPAAKLLCVLLRSIALRQTRSL